MTEKIVVWGDALHDQGTRQELQSLNHKEKVTRLELLQEMLFILHVYYKI